MNLNHLDLNLLKVLLVLLEEKNTHRAADKLDTSQPAVSRALGRLREAFDDQLFVRHNRGLKLTPRAEELAAVLPGIYTQLEKALESKQFNPAEMEGRFRIALNGFLIESYGTEIYHLFNRYCPKVELELYSFGSSTISQLQDDRCDLAITYQPLTTPKTIYQKNIAKSQFGFICRRGLIEEHRTIPIEELDNYRWAGMVVPGFNEQMELVRKYVNLNVKPAFRSQHAIPILQAIRSEDMLFIAPRELYHIVDQKKYQFVEMDEQGHAFRRDIMDIVIAYNQKHWNTEKYRWIEQLLKEIKVTP
ncbi:LysR family transcriptional regulator [Photobacterium gaetbulicola]|uniref:Putative Transcriptional regulator, LysR family n=1 Tax=Photobacterium gaetbulicola Gung47 TaxID=658445 RepID=A0A0C5WNN1_9GAMM|nr:LysR family transcriptional regulator [Photobacterium gaetbulicola]AJR08703.1 putative Transcriptional regulator, LysR family [Photobacterium gaetbulicola Gung47]PSU10336.1 LysR family transcriptional regulator [Photobacterium gaetbulicola]